MHDDEQSTVKVVVTTPIPSLSRKVLHVNAGAYPETLDPQKSSYVNEVGHLSLIYEGLTRLNAAQETVPGAAERWTYKLNATELDFYIRANLKYSDGSLLNAARFKYSLMRNIDPETASEYAFITDEIKGAYEWGTCGDVQATCAAARKVVDNSIQALHPDGSACAASNRYEDPACTVLKLTLARPAPYFHAVLSLWTVYPAKEENIAAGRDAWWTSAKYQVGNGPYILESLEPGKKAVFVPNPNYHDTNAKVDIEFSYWEDSSAALTAYRNNELDVTTASSDYAAIMADIDLSKQVEKYTGTCTFAIMFHQSREPFNDPKVRQAFAQAFDRAAWVEEVLSGLGAPTLTWIPPGFPGYDPTERRWGFDPAAARQALAASRYGSASKLPAIKLTFSDSPRNRTRFEWLAAQWKAQLGVNVALDPVDATAYNALREDPKTAPLVQILGWCADFPDPYAWLSVYWKTDAYATYRIDYSNQALDARLNQADIEMDPARRMQLYTAAQKLLLDDVPVAMAWNNVNLYLVKPWVKGYTPCPADNLFPGNTDPTTIDIDWAAKSFMYVN